MIHTVLSRVRRSTTHPLVVSLFVALVAFSDPTRSSILLGMFPADEWMEKVRLKIRLRRAA